MSRTVINKYDTTIEGNNITVKVVKPKLKVKQNNRARNKAICPECNSTLTVGQMGSWECNGDKLILWEKSFYNYHKANDERKIKILNTVSDISRFEYLYGRWVTALENGESNVFDCGYTNNIFPPLSTNKTKLPDPIFINRIEKQLGRKLTEEELIGEHELWFFRGQYFTKYRKGAKKVKIPTYIFPDDVISRESK